MNGIFWIGDEPKVPLAVVACPRGDGVLNDQLATLKEGGIETVVSLLENDEAAWLGLAEEAKLAEQAGMKFLNYPIPDRNPPLDPPTFRAFVRALADRVAAGEHIGIHCRGSIGRSTVAAACTLIHLGWGAATALAAIESARGCQVPDTLVQERWILKYKPTP